MNDKCPICNGNLDDSNTKIRLCLSCLTVWIVNKDGLLTKRSDYGILS